jgi:hypothetical protein
MSGYPEAVAVAGQRAGRGIPRMRWDTMLRWICSVPPYTLAGRDLK